jgi:PX domain
MDVNTTSEDNLVLSEEQFKSRNIVKSSLRRHPINSIAIPATKILSTTVLYEVLCSNGELEWSLWIRYDKFYHLHKEMLKLWHNRVSYQDRLPPFPEKHNKLFVDHLDQHFVQVRHILLANYLKRILSTRAWRSSRAFIAFVIPGVHCFDCIIHTDSNITNAAADADVPVNAATNAATNVAADANANVNVNVNVNANSSSAVDQDDQKHISPGHSPSTRPHGFSYYGTRGIVEHAVMPASNDELDSVVDNATQSVSGSASLYDAPIRAFPTSEELETHDVTFIPEVTDISIPAAQILRGDHVIYQLDISNALKSQPYGSWVVLKRFAEFREFNVILRNIVADLFPRILRDLPHLPGREPKLLVNHLDPTFIEKRRLLLENYLRVLVALPDVQRIPEFLEFLGV